MTLCSLFVMPALIAYFEKRNGIKVLIVITSLASLINLIVNFSIAENKTIALRVCTIIIVVVNMFILFDIDKKYMNKKNEKESVERTLNKLDDGITKNKTAFIMATIVLPLLFMVPLILGFVFELGSTMHDSYVESIDKNRVIYEKIDLNMDEIYERDVKVKYVDIIGSDGDYYHILVGVEWLEDERLVSQELVDRIEKNDVKVYSRKSIVN